MRRIKTLHWTGFVSCKKKNRNAKNMASAGARAYMGVWGRCPQWGPGADSLVRGSGGLRPLKLKAFYCRREQIWILFIIGLLNFAAICRKGPERRSGDQKKNRNGVPVRSGWKRTLAVTDETAGRMHSNFLRPITQCQKPSSIRLSILIHRLVTEIYRHRHTKTGR